MKEEVRRPVDNQVVKPGFLLFFSQLIVAAGGWIYWVVISKFATTADIGDATTIYSLTLLFGTLMQLGLEYPLLKRSSKNRELFGTTLVIEIALAAIFIPIILYLAGTYNYGSIQEIGFAIGIFLISAVSFVARFALLGISNVRIILIFDVLGMCLKFGSGFLLVLQGYGSLGILISFFLQASLAVVGTVFFARNAFGLRIGNLVLVKEILKDGLANLPSKFSNLLVVSLSVILLASYGISSGDVGIFYMVIMMTLIAGSFASSLSFMSLPASSVLNRDLSTRSMKISIIFTTPIIVALVMAPKDILAILGNDYIKASDLLTILALAILPSLILSNATAKFNNYNESRKILAIGLVRVVAFMVLFIILVPSYGMIGAAFSILISLSSSAALSLIWFGRPSIALLAMSTLGITAGITLGLIARFLGFEHPMFVVVFSVLGVFGIFLGLRFTSTQEIMTVLRGAKKV